MGRLGLDVTRAPLIAALIALETWACMGGPAAAQESTSVDASEDAPEDAGETEVALETGEAESDEAQQLFVDARAAFDERRYADARRLLLRSLELVPRSATAVNLARVLRSVGEPLGAERVLDDLLDGRYGNLSRDRRATVREMRDEARSEVAQLTVATRGAERVVLRVDGTRVRSISAGSTHQQRVDPGEHVVLGNTADGRTAEETVMLDPGGEATVTLAFPEPSTPPSAADEDDSLLSSPWLWVGLAAVLAGAAAAALILSSGGGGTADPVEDPQGVFPVVEALRF